MESFDTDEYYQIFDSLRVQYSKGYVLAYKRASVDQGTIILGAQVLLSAAATLGVVKPLLELLIKRYFNHNIEINDKRISDVDIKVVKNNMTQKEAENFLKKYIDENSDTIEIVVKKI